MKLTYKQIMKINHSSDVLFGYVEDNKVYWQVRGIDTVKNTNNVISVFGTSLVERYVKEYGMTIEEFESVKNFIPKPKYFGKSIGVNLGEVLILRTEPYTHLSVRRVEITKDRVEYYKPARGYVYNDTGIQKLITLDNDTIMDLMAFSVTGKSLKKSHKIELSNERRVEPITKENFI